MLETGDSDGDAFVISDDVILIYALVVFTVICQLLNTVGIFTNIINIICFVKQGFKESVNISLLGLSISDLCSLATTVGICIFLTPAVISADLPFEPIEISYLTAMPRFSFIRVSSCITAMITLERCLCIVAPLKIKMFITPRRAAIVTVSIFIIFFCSNSPVYIVNRLGMKFSALRNKTIVGLVSVENRDYIEKVSSMINNFAIPFIAFVIVVICTAILTFKLRGTTKWTQTSVGIKQAEKISNRNQKVSKMVVMISILFIFCFVPNCITILALAFIPALSFQGKYLNTTILLAGIGYILECINSSMNIFVYYQMSSKYRDTCYQILYCLKRSEQHKHMLTNNINRGDGVRKE